MELIGKRYELTKNLGSGSFGEAYLARDRRDDKAICLKLLRIVDSESIADIAGEFRLLSQLEHPNLIRVYDFGIDEKYGPYFTLEYAVNGNLGAILPLSPEKFISAVHSICAALDFVHGSNIIHGDLKPANILLDATDNYRLSDFGLAFILGGEDKARSSGSALYIAPEVLRREGASSRSDIFSLGLLFYEMIMGRPPFDGKMTDILSRKLSGQIRFEPIPIEYGGEKMGLILKKMTSIDPHRRYQTIEQVRQEIAELGLEGRSESSVSTLGRIRFVGRKDELAWLEGGLERWKQGNGTTLFLGGEPGIGKSWLLDELRVRSQVKGCRFYLVHCREEDLKPFSPILNLLSYIFDELDPGLKRFSSYGPDLKRLFPVKFAGARRHELSESDIKSVRRRMLDNLLQYFGDISATNRAIFAIEDLQWADSDTLEFLKLAFEFTTYAKDRAPFIICTGQSDAEGVVPAFKPLSPDQQKILAGPDNETWESFLAGLLGTSRLPSNFSSRVYRETGGNFLFTTEVIKELVDAKILKRLRGEWSIEPSWAEQIKVPQGIRSVIAKRLSRLRPELKSITDLAAVLGRSFISQELIGLGISKIDSRLAELIASGIFWRFKIGDRERIDFIHGQLRRVAYDLLSKEKREDLHLKIAEYFEPLGAEPEFLGYHFLAGKMYNKADNYLTHSALNAERIFAYRKAADFYRQALECVESRPDNFERNDHLFDICIGLGKALDFFSPSEASEPFLKAVQMAEMGNLEQLAEAAIRTGNNYIHIGENEKAELYLEKGLEAAQEAKQSRLLGEAYTGLGFAFDKQGRLDEADKAYLKALNALSEIDFPEGSCRVLNYMGIIRKRRGDFSGALDFYRRALDISIEQKFLWSAMNLYGNLGNLSISKGDYQSGLDHYIKSLHISEEISDRRIEAINLLNIGHTYNEIGELEQAEKHFYRAIHKLKDIGDKGSEAITLNNLGLLYYRKGEIYKSIEHYKKGLELAKEINQPRAELANHIGLVEDLVAIADFEKAGIEAEMARDMAQAINDVEQLAAALSLLAEIKFETGDLDSARAETETFLSLSDQIGDSAQRARILLIAKATGATDLPLNELDKNARTGPIVTRFGAGDALKKSKNPEIWIARLEDAIRKTHFQPGETWRMRALKAKLLTLNGDKYESLREKDKLGEEVSRALLGLEPKALSKLMNYLQITEKAGKIMDRIENINRGSREERLEVLIRVARTINTIRELDPLLNKIMDLALETIGGERGFIMLFSDIETGAERILEPRVARNLAREDILGETTISHSSAMDVARSGKPLLLGRSDDQVDPRQSMVAFRISSVLCAPLAVKGEVLGIVYVDSRSGKTFTGDDLDFLVSFADLAAIAIENASLAERLAKKNIYLQKQVESIWGFGNIVGRSNAMQKVFRMAESVAETDVTVVITGESGTGKELLARAIHFASPRKNGRFMPVDCGAMAENLLESELFGYIKGAFTGAVSDREGLFEAAQGGTVFLDEISNTSKNFQAKLLRVLQESEIRRVGDNRTRKVDVRVIAATNKDIEQEVKAGNFREDLYYRLNVVNISLPPLKDRPEDIPLLADYFLQKICAKMKIPAKTFSSGALDSLLLFSWPGNVRQLENVCERVIIFSKQSSIDLDALPLEIRSHKSDSKPTSAAVSVPKTKAELKAEKAKMERLFLMNILNRAAGNIMEASRLSGMDRSQIHHLMSRFGISGSDYKKAD